MKKSKYVMMPVALCGALLLAACGDSSSNTPQSNNSGTNGTTPPTTQPGLAERTGRAIDHAAEKTGDALERAGEKTADAARNAKDKISDTTRDLADRAEKTADRTGDKARDTGKDIEKNVDDTATRAANAMRPSPAPDAGVGVAPGVMNNQPVTTPTTRPGESTAQLPGLPSVTGTDTSNLKTADAAAQRLLDKAQVEAQKGDTGHVRRLISELKGMRSSLSPDFQKKVDELAKAYPEQPSDNPTPTANDR